VTCISRVQTKPVSKEASKRVGVNSALASINEEFGSQYERKAEGNVIERLQYLAAFEFSCSDLTDDGLLNWLHGILGGG
jgi:hypothetical protein